MRSAPRYVVIRLLRWWLRGRRLRRCSLAGWGRILPRGDVGHLRLVRNLATRGFSYVDAGVIQQQAGGAIELDA